MTSAGRHPTRPWSFTKTQPVDIFLDIVIISVSASSTGPWNNIFYWGDGNPSNNGTIHALSLSPAANLITRQSNARTVWYRNPEWRHDPVSASLHLTNMC